LTGASLRGAKERRTAPKEVRKLSASGRGFAICFVILLLMGLIVLYAASYYNAQDQTGNPFSEVISQVQGVALGAVAMMVIYRMDYRKLRKPVFTGGLLVLSFVLLTLVAIPGVGRMVNGSRRWLRIGPIGFQPSELAKYAMILFFARTLSSRKFDVALFWKGIVPVLTLPLLMFALILLQPNLSTAGAILIAAALMIMLAGARWGHLAVLGMGGAALGTFYALSEPYRRARLMSFRNPFAYLSNEGYQLSQSLLAFGSGGLFGMGLGKGRQKFSFLPYPESDFIFAVVGEDMGFFGCIIILTLFMALIYFGLRIAIDCEDRFGSLLAAGIVTMIGVQTVMNVAVVIGLMPTTGLPLPFFSAGGTSISILMAAVAVVLNIAHAPIFRADIV
jgi:cell division protein FtsW